MPPSIQVWRSVCDGGDTKTKKSRRTLALPLRCVDALILHRDRQQRERAKAGKDWTEDDLVFATSSGAELDAASWTPRELRHSFVSLLSSGGVRIEDIPTSWATPVRG